MNLIITIIGFITTTLSIFWNFYKSKVKIERMHIFIQKAILNKKDQVEKVILLPLASQIGFKIKMILEMILSGESVDSTKLSKLVAFDIKLEEWYKQLKN